MTTTTTVAHARRSPPGSGTARPRTPDRRRDAGEGPRHLAGGHLGASTGTACSTSRTRCLALGVKPGDRVAIQSENRREWLLRRPRGRRGPRRHRRALPDQPGRRGRLPARRLGRPDPRRRGPGAGRQGARGARRPARTWNASSTWSRAESGAATTTRACSSGTGCSTLGREHRAANPGAVDDADGRRHSRRPRHAHLHLRHDRPAQGRDADRRPTSSSRSATLVDGGGFTSPAADRPRRDAVVPAAVPRRRAHLHHLVQRRRRRPGELRRVDRDRAGEPARGPADDPVRGAADLGEGAGRRHDPGRPPPRSNARTTGSGWRCRRPDRGHPGRAPAARHTAGTRLLYAVGYLLLFRALQGPDRDAQGALRRLGRRTDRARRAAVLHGHRRADARGVRDDREQRDRHREPARPGQARHRRGAAARHGAADRRDDRRDPHPPSRHVRRLLAPTRGDRAGARARRLAAHRRRRRVGRRHARPDHRPDEGHHHHGRRQERRAVGDRERAQGLAVRQGGGRRRRPPRRTSRR